MAAGTASDKSVNDSGWVDVKPSGDGEWMDVKGPILYRPPALEAARAEVAQYPQEFQQSPEAAQARGAIPEMSQRALTERLWQPLTTGLVSPSTITRAVSGRTPEELIRSIAEREAQGKVPGLPGMAISAGRVLSPFTSPVSLGTMALGPVAGTEGALGTAAKVALEGTALPLATEGGINLLAPRREGETEPQTLERRLTGGAQLAGGLAGTLKAGPEPLRMTARGTGAALQTTGRIAGAPIRLASEGPGLTYRGIPVSPAAIAGGVAGTMIGERIAPGWVGYVAGAPAGMITGAKLAQGLEKLGGGLRRLGGYEAPPTPPEPIEAAEARRIIIPSETAPSLRTRRIIKLGEEHEPERIKGGAPWTWTNEKLIEMAKAGDEDARRIASDRGLNWRGGPTSYGNVPLPRGEVPPMRAKKIMER
jgi:hypothetical protein